MEKKKITNLTILDVIIVGVILFGLAIFESTLVFLHAPNTQNVLQNNLNNNVNFYSPLIRQSILLLLAFWYLYLRKFDFRV